jgi:glycosyltransferase involved in cell wall biosynthesis
VRPDLSIVIPVYNEAPNLEELHREIVAALDRGRHSFEVLFIDDGSTDDSFERLRRIHARDRRVRVIQFRRNFGQTAGFAAGFAEARGRLIVTMDGDRQNDPADIPALVETLEAQDMDVVCGWRRERKDPFFSRRLPSTIANRLISWATGVRLNDYGCSLKVYRAEVVKPLHIYGELHRFLPALVSEVGARIAEQPVNHRPRTQGRSKYGISRTVRVILDLVTVKFLVSYATRPLQVFGLLGAAMGLTGFGICLYIAWLKYIGRVGIGDWKLLLGILLIFTGVQLVTLGLLAEMQARTYLESQGKRVYVIRQRLDAFDASDELPHAAIDRVTAG